MDRALADLRWRGPDLETRSIWRDRLYLGQTVLSLTGDIKESHGEHLRSKSDRYQLVFNGEIYNYRELAQSLEPDRFPSLFSRETTDSEVLVNMYEAIRPSEVPRRLDGMYAFVILDTERQVLHAARDPQGEKALYIYEDDEFVILASEIKAILRLRPDLIPDPQTLRDYFRTRHFMFIERTPFTKIRQLRPGHTETLDLNSFQWTVTDRQHPAEWISESKMSSNEFRSLDDLTDELDSLLNSCTREMIPDGRRYASVVSGGVDSSLLSRYVMRNGDPEVLVAVNHVGKDQISSDLDGFERVLERRIHRLDVDMPAYSAEIPRCMDVLRSPLFSHSFVGQAIQTSYVRATGCKVMFGGEGADELFGGYSCYLDKTKWEPDTLTSPSWYSGEVEPSIRFKYDNPEKLRAELSDAWRVAIQSYAHVRRTDERAVYAMMFCDFFHQLAAVGLRGSDLMSMMSSVETRSIFVRKPIVSFALNLPLSAKLAFDSSFPAGQRTKHILKRLFLRYFPENLLVEKQGFSGFPNESAAYLGQPSAFLAWDFLGFDSGERVWNTDRSTDWKLINIEYFLRSHFR